jgi:hypothetical protein
MHGTIAFLHLKPGKREELHEFMRTWEHGSLPHVEGAIAHYISWLDEDANGAIFVAIFDSKAAYRANAESPEQTSAICGCARCSKRTRSGTMASSRPTCDSV